MNPSQGLKALTLQMVRVGIIIEIVVKLLHQLALQFIYPTCKKPYGSYFSSRQELDTNTSDLSH